MSKILPEHLARSAFVYVRQSPNDRLLLGMNRVVT
jgi:hypothetical protein